MRRITHLSACMFQSGILGDLNYLHPVGWMLYGVGTCLIGLQLLMPGGRVLLHALLISSMQLVPLALCAAHAFANMCDINLKATASNCLRVETCACVCIALATWCEACWLRHVMPVILCLRFSCSGLCCSTEVANWVQCW